VTPPRYHVLDLRAFMFTNIDDQAIASASPRLFLDAFVVG